MNNKIFTDKIFTDKINIEVSAGLNVDDKTARLCMDLLSIYFGNAGFKGCVLRFTDDGCFLQDLFA